MADQTDSKYSAPDADAKLPARQNRYGDSVRRKDAPFSFLKNRRCVLVGIGNPLRRDDGAGPFFIDRVAGHISAECINAETTPENHIGEIVSCRPDIILFIDAMDFGGSPGTYCIVKAEDVYGGGISTHDIPLKLLISLIRQQCRAACYVLGIQPENRELSMNLSVTIEQTLEELEKLIVEVLPNRN